MRTRSRFVLLFAVQAVAAAVASFVFAFGAMAREDARAEAEIGAVPMSAVARDAEAPPAERLAAALGEADRLRARAASGRVYRSQAAIEAAASVAAFSAAWAAAAFLLFTIGAKRLTRRLDELAAGAASASADRSFRFPASRDAEFGPVFSGFNGMLDRIAEQDARLADAARLEGWKEVSSFLFHQLKSPLSSLELASRNVSLAVSAAEAGSMGAEAALAASARSAANAQEECAVVRALLDRFRSLSGLALGPAEPFSAEELAAALRSRLAPGRASIDVEGPEAVILADRRMVEEAFLNLVVNAAEACASPPAAVRIAFASDGSRVVASVSDSNGPVDPSVFERVRAGRFSTKAEGTGLGLLFVRRVAALHGGGFEVGPTETGGFGCLLSLPAYGGSK